MEEVANTRIIMMPVERLQEAHDRGWLTWEGLVASLKWQTTVGDGAATIFLSDVSKSQHLAVAIRSAGDLASKINLLVDASALESGRSRGFRAIRDAVKKGGYCLNRYEWSLLERGKEQVVLDLALQAIAGAFNVPPDYLLRDDEAVPEQINIKLQQVREKRRAKVRRFATRALEQLDPIPLAAIAKILDEEQPDLGQA